MTRIAFLCQERFQCGKPHPQAYPRGSGAALCNNPAAYVLKRAQQAGVPAVLFSREELESPEREHSVLGLLREHRVDLIILAGFQENPGASDPRHPGKIVNIHPALLPKYGGPGMYGDRVHKAVLITGKPARDHRTHC